MSKKYSSRGAIPIIPLVIVSAITVVTAITAVITTRQIAKKRTTVTLAALKAGDMCYDPYQFNSSINDCNSCPNGKWHYEGIYGYCDYAPSQTACGTWRTDKCSGSSCGSGKVCINGHSLGKPCECSTLPWVSPTTTPKLKCPDGTDQFKCCPSGNLCVRKANVDEAFCNPSFPCTPKVCDTGNCLNDCVCRGNGVGECNALCASQAPLPPPGGGPTSPPAPRPPGCKDPTGDHWGTDGTNCTTNGWALPKWGPYEVYLYIDDQYKAPPIAANQTGGSNNNAFNIDLRPYIKDTNPHSVRIKALDSCGGQWTLPNSPKSITCSAAAQTTVSPPPGCPSAPSGFSYSCNAAANQTTISWNPLSGVAKYILRMNAAPYSEWVGSGDFAVYPTTNSVTVGINPSTDYRYDVQGIMPGEIYPYCGGRAPFATLRCNPPSTQPPSPPASVSPTQPPLPIGQCWGVQHCTNGSTTVFEYCGECVGAGCRQGFTCANASYTCKTYPDKVFFFDELYPVSCSLLGITVSPTIPPTSPPVTSPTQPVTISPTLPMTTSPTSSPSVTISPTDIPTTLTPPPPTATPGPGCNRGQDFYTVGQSYCDEVNNIVNSCTAQDTWQQVSPHPCEGSCVDDPGRRAFSCLARCEALIANPGNKLKVAFLPENYADVREFRAAALKAVDQIKKTNLGNLIDKMNFYIVNDYNQSYHSPSTNPYTGVDFQKIHDTGQSICGANSSTVIDNPTTCGSEGGAAIWGLSSYACGSDGQVVPHLLSHVIAGLSDEYGDAGSPTGQELLGPNCSDDSSCSKWSSLANTGCFQGCGTGKEPSYGLSNLYRPSEISIMRLSPDNYTFNPPSLKAWEEVMVNFE